MRTPPLVLWPARRAFAARRVGEARRAARRGGAGSAPREDEGGVCGPARPNGRARPHNPTLDGKPSPPRARGSARRRTAAGRPTYREPEQNAEPSLRRENSWATIPPKPGAL